MIIAVGDTCGFGGVTLGQTDVNGVELYFLNIDGWGASKSTAQPIQRGRGDGGFASEAWLQYRTFTVTGAIVAPDRASLVLAQDTLNAAASIQPQPLTIVNAGMTRSVVAQRQDEVLYKETSDISVEFTISFFAVDPRKLGPLVSQTTNLPSSTGGLTYPITYPITYTGVTNSGVVSIVNAGNTLAPVKLRIVGPVQGPIVTHVGSGLSLVFASSLVLGSSSEWLDVDMEARTVLAQGQSSRNGYVTSRGWFSADPGANDYAFQAQAYDPAAQLTVTVPSGAWL